MEPRSVLLGRRHMAARALDMVILVFYCCVCLWEAFSSLFATALGLADRLDPRGTGVFGALSPVLLRVAILQAASCLLLLGLDAAACMFQSMGPTQAPVLHRMVTCVTAAVKIGMLWSGMGSSDACCILLAASLIFSAVAVGAAEESGSTSGVQATATIRWWTACPPSWCLPNVTHPQLTQSSLRACSGSAASEAARPPVAPLVVDLQRGLNYGRPPVVPVRRDEGISEFELAGELAADVAVYEEQLRRLSVSRRSGGRGSDSDTPISVLSSSNLEAALTPSSKELIEQTLSNGKLSMSPGERASAFPPSRLLGRSLDIKPQLNDSQPISMSRPSSQLAAQTSQAPYLDAVRPMQPQTSPIITPTDSRGPLTSQLPSFEPAQFLQTSALSPHTHSVPGSCSYAGPAVSHISVFAELGMQPLPHPEHSQNHRGSQLPSSGVGMLGRQTRSGGFRSYTSQNQRDSQLLSSGAVSLAEHRAQLEDQLAQLAAEECAAQLQGGDTLWTAHMVLSTTDNLASSRLITCNISAAAQPLSAALPARKQASSESGRADPRRSDPWVAHEQSLKRVVSPQLQSFNGRVNPTSTFFDHHGPSRVLSTSSRQASAQHLAQTTRPVSDVLTPAGSERLISQASSLGLGKAQDSVRLSPDHSGQAFRQGPGQWLGTLTGPEQGHPPVKQQPPPPHFQAASLAWSLHNPLGGLHPHAHAHAHASSVRQLAVDQQKDMVVSVAVPGPLPPPQWQGGAPQGQGGAAQTKSSPLTKVPCLCTAPPVAVSQGQSRHSGKYSASRLLRLLDIVLEEEEDPHKVRVGSDVHAQSHSAQTRGAQSPSASGTASPTNTIVELTLATGPEAVVMPPLPPPLPPIPAPPGSCVAAIVANPQYAPPRPTIYSPYDPPPFPENSFNIPRPGAFAPPPTRVAVGDSGPAPFDPPPVPASAPHAPRPSTFAPNPTRPTIHASCIPPLGPARAPQSPRPSTLAPNATRPTNYAPFDPPMDPACKARAPRPAFFAPNPTRVAVGSSRHAPPYPTPDMGRTRAAGLPASFDNPMEDFLLVSGEAYNLVLGLLEPNDCQRSAVVMNDVFGLGFCGVLPARPSLTSVSPPEPPATVFNAVKKLDQFRKSMQQMEESHSSKAPPRAFPSFTSMRQ